MFCAYCGKDIADTDMFCAYCGKPTVYYRDTHAQTATAQQRKEGKYTDSGTAETENIPVYDSDTVVEQLVGKNLDYYMPKFLNMQYGGSKIKWNWCSFLFPAYWYIYRKMYAYAAGYFVLFWILSAMGGMGIMVQIMSGLMGNCLYYGHIGRLAVQARALKDEQRNRFISKKGGVNPVGVAVFIIFIAVLLVLFGSFLYAVYLYSA